jgi:hypothetical protein
MADWMKRRREEPRTSLSSRASRMGTGKKKTIFMVEMISVLTKTW